jgi:hypothetical protein
MTEQPGLRTPTYPKSAPEKKFVVEQNPITPPLKGEGDASNGGAPDFQSHPQPENTFKKHTT